MNHSRRVAIIKILHKIYSSKKFGLQYNSNFELLIALILSAKSNDYTVNKVTKNLFIRANTPEKILSLNKKLIENIIRSVGLFKRKTNSILKTCKIIVNQYNGSIPDNKNALESLPGVGKKIANVILNVVFHVPIIAVDTHVFRVCNRTKFLSGKTYTFLEKNLNSVVSKNFRMYFHNLFVLHGKNICKAKKPNCMSCPIRNLCEFEDK